MDVRRNLFLRVYQSYEGNSNNLNMLITKLFMQHNLSFVIDYL